MKEHLRICITSKSGLSFLATVMLGIRASELSRMPGHGTAASRGQSGTEEGTHPVDFKGATPGLMSPPILGRTGLLSRAFHSNLVQPDIEGLPRSEANSQESRVLTGFFQLDSRNSVSPVQGGRITV